MAATQALRPSKIGTFDYQPKLPRLPIPSLRETADRYLLSIQPLLTPEQFAESRRKVEEFVKPGGFGEVLQARLQAYDKTRKSSWLGRMWLELAYLTYREPVAVNSNWWGICSDHPHHPQDLIQRPPPEGVVTDFQLHRTAGFISNLLTFNDLLNSERVSPDTMRKTPICMHQYRFLFSTTRIPVIPCDQLVHEYPARQRHIVVGFRDQIYRVEVVGEGGKRVPIKQIEDQLRQVVELEKSSKQKEPAVGYLTSENRDVWAKAREHMMKIGGSNPATFKEIESALFFVAIEDRSPSADLDTTSRYALTSWDGATRWWDKSIQIIAMSNGRIGISGEHSPADATVPARMFEDCVHAEPAQEPEAVATGVALAAPKKLAWTADNVTLKYIEDAKKSTRALIADTQNVVMHYMKYGDKFIKEVGKASPDAYVQMAMQLAYYRDQGHFTATYETAATRSFLHGRTETTRTLSNESVAFVHAMNDPALSAKEKYAALQKAVQKHIKYVGDAFAGRGVDRHLLGLRMMQQKGDPLPEPMFADPVFAQSQTWKLSTSNVSPGDFSLGLGFGPVVPDGYGINYNISNTRIQAGICARTHAKNTDPDRLRAQFIQALDEMGRICIAVNGAGSNVPASKL